MKTTRIALFALLLLGATAGVASAAVAADIHVGPSGRASVDVGFFYDDLASYGNWVERPSYGWVVDAARGRRELAPLRGRALGLDRPGVDLDLGRALRLGDLSLWTLV